MYNEKKRYSTLPEFVNGEVIQPLGEFADDYDVETIADEISEFDGRCFVLKDEYATDDEGRAFWEACDRHEVK